MSLTRSDLLVLRNKWWQSWVWSQSSVMNHILKLQVIKMNFYSLGKKAQDTSPLLFIWCCATHSHKNTPSSESFLIRVPPTMLFIQETQLWKCTHAAADTLSEKSRSSSSSVQLLHQRWTIHHNEQPMMEVLRQECIGTSSDQKLTLKHDRLNILSTEPQSHSG